MFKSFILLLGAVALPITFSAQTVNDTTALSMNKILDEVVVVARRPYLKQDPDKIVYIIRNDPYAKGMNGIELLGRIPRVSLINDIISVAGKNSVKYIVDGHLLEMPDEAITMKLKNLQADGISKIELLTTPPAKYATGNNVAYISITTRNESLGTRGTAWSRGSFSDKFNYSMGGNMSHTTRKAELSGDASWNDAKGKNDIYQKYSFADNTRISSKSTSFTWHTLGANGLLKYKPDERVSLGTIVNYSSNRMGSIISDKTTDKNSNMISTSNSPSYPDNALTLTGFIDWIIDSKGKMMSVTYNYFDKTSSSLSDVTTLWDNSDKAMLTKDADNQYQIHSAKLDMTLPFQLFKMETGAAYTKISNNTNLIIYNDLNGQLKLDPTQSNNFIYNEKTAAVYLSAEKNFGRSFFGKIALRYEHTNVTGRQKTDDHRHDQSYGYLFPTLNLSQNFTGAGRLSADYSMGIIRPGFGDLNPFRYYTTVQNYFTGNPDLKSVIVHNAGINYSYKGLYTVIYSSWNRNAVGYITRFSSDGMQWTTPENCINTTKTGIYASYNRSIFDWWNINAGGEIFYSQTTSKSTDYHDETDRGYSGKVELNTSWMLNRQKTMIFNIRTSHFFPYKEKMIKYENRTIINCELRYMLLDNRLSLTASVSDPFGWNITKSTVKFKDYDLKSRVNIHSHSIAIRIAYSFGSRKVNNVYRDTKERESHRSN